MSPSASLSFTYAMSVRVQAGCCNKETLPRQWLLLAPLTSPQRAVEGSWGAAGVAPRAAPVRASSGQQGAQESPG